MSKHGIVVTAAVLAAAAGAWAQVPAYTEFTRVGLLDAEHTAPSGYQYTYTNSVNASGLVAGYSWRLSGEQRAGDSTWVWSKEMGMIRTGFFDAEHTRTDGFRNSGRVMLSDAGREIGWSDRFVGGSAAGRSAWGWSAGMGTVRLGFTDAQHTRVDGVQTSQPYSQNPAGQVIGWSDRYSGGGAAGRSAWYWDASGGHIRLGLTDVLHTNVDGAQWSGVSGINALGRVAGTSYRYDDDSVQNSTAWTWASGEGHTQLGYMDAEHTGASGQRSSGASHVGDGGHVFGRSRRFAGTSDPGNISTWVWGASDGLSRVGLTDAEHTSSEGKQNSTVWLVRAGDRAAGYSERYSGVFERGRSAWVWSPSGGTVRVGLAGSKYLSASGSRSSVVRGMNDAGYAWGGSTTYLHPTNGEASSGDEAWVWSPITENTVQVGLTGAQYVRTDQTRESAVVDVNNAGQATGTSSRFDGSLQLGSVGWYFDPLSGVNTPLIFSTSSTGLVQTIPQLITESGYVLGAYMQWTTPDGGFPHAFAWSPTDGLIELGLLVPGGLSPQNLTRLGGVLNSRELETLLVGGSLTGAPWSGAMYVMQVPAPGTGLVLLLGVGAARRRRGVGVIA